MTDKIAAKIIALEKAALDRWGRGDPDGFLEICSPDVVYFDPYLELRIDGLAALKDYYETIRGKIFFDRFELLNPMVQKYGTISVLTFNYRSYSGDAISRWNCTEGYRFINSRWLIFQTHWSFTNVFKYKMNN